MRARAEDLLILPHQTRVRLLLLLLLLLLLVVVRSISVFPSSFNVLATLRLLLLLPPIL